jgi:hypothetical protein
MGGESRNAFGRHRTSNSAWAKSRRFRGGRGRCSPCGPRAVPAPRSHGPASIRRYEVFLLILRKRGSNSDSL